MCSHVARFPSIETRMLRELVETKVSTTSAAGHDVLLPLVLMLLLLLHRSASGINTLV